MTAIEYNLPFQQSYPVPSLFTAGSSETAEFLNKSTHEIRSRMYESNYFGLQFKVILKELDIVAGECGSPGWDGYNALPVSQDTVDLAYRFISALPLNIKLPEIGAEPDGCISFEWYKSPRKIFSVSVAQSGFIHYALLDNLIKRHGSEPFIGSISKEIISLINEITR